MARSRRRPSRKRSSRRGNWGAVPYVLGALIAVAVLVGALVWKGQTEDQMAVDQETLCPLSTGPVSMTVILFDLTDPLSTAQSKQLIQYLDDEIKASPTGTQFSMGVVREDSDAWGATDPLCKPRSGDDVSNLTQNVRLIDKRYKDRFLTPLRGHIQDMISATAANQSPIMEALQTLIADTPGFLTFAGPRRVILVSDLLQHSDAMSFYRGDDWQGFAASAGYDRLGKTLDGAEVAIFAVPRSVEKIKDPNVVEDFWLRYFDIQGTNLPTFKKLGDL